MSSSSLINHRYVICVLNKNNNNAETWPFVMPEDADVASLWREIHDHPRYEGVLKHSTLTLYKVGVQPDNQNLNIEPSETLRDRALDWLCKGPSRNPMQPALTLADYFPSGPAHKEAKKIDIIAVISEVVAESKVVPAKRSYPSVESPFEILKRSKFATTAPSTFATPSVYEKNQETDQRILDDRPCPDTDVPPIALLYAGFGNFIDIYRGDKEAPPSSREDTVRFEMAVDEFAESMVGFFDHEDGRRDTAAQIVSKILSFFAGPVTVTPAQFGSNISDGHILGQHQMMVFIQEVKNHFCAGKADPMVQGTSHVAHKLKMVMERDEHRRDLFGRSRLPSLGLTIAGPYIAFYAVIFLGGKFRAVNLTPTLSCVRSACDGQDRKGLYTAFAAASVLLRDIREDISHFDDDVLVNQHSDIFFPYVHSLPMHNDCTDAMFNFRIYKRHDDRQDYRLLYIAKTNDNEEIIVKFVRQYSLDLHKFCADCGHAPKIRGFGKLAGGWCAVAMDYYPTALPILGAQKLSDCRERWASELQCLVDSFHRGDLVHGDLRDANIICDNEKMMLVDFDWGGRSGEACYPTVRLNPELTDGRYETGLKIRIADDNRVLEKTLKKIRGV